MPKKESTPPTPPVNVYPLHGGGYKELGRADFRAQQVPGAVIIFAEGWHPTSGYVDFFEQSPIDIYPPEFILWQIAPTGPTLDVITPFAIWVMFGAEEPIKTVRVTDADGTHEIKVEQTPDVKVTKSTRTWVHSSVGTGAPALQRGGETTIAVGEEEPAAAASARPPLTTLAVGEEGPGPTTLAVGEESQPTTYMLGEEGPTTLAIGEEGPPMTTLRLGEEGATTLAIGEEGPTTYMVGEEGPTTLALGEEGATTDAIGEEGPTTLALGEEGPTTLRLGEEGPTTQAIGEEGPTTYMLGEEESRGNPSSGNPFGSY